MWKTEIVQSIINYIIRVDCEVILSANGNWLYEVPRPSYQQGGPQALLLAGRSPNPLISGQVPRPSYQRGGPQTLLSAGRSPDPVISGEVPTPSYQRGGLVPGQSQEVHIRCAHSSWEARIQTVLRYRLVAVLRWVELAVRSGPTSREASESTVHVPIQHLQ